MNLDDISNASLCVLDTNILLYAKQDYSHQAQRILRRCSYKKNSAKRLAGLNHKDRIQGAKGSRVQALGS
jgi:hypothetical protein